MSVNGEVPIIVETPDSEGASDVVSSRVPVEPNLFCINRRDCALKYLQSMTKREAERRGGTLDLASFANVFSRQDALAMMFQLFDFEARDRIPQESFFSNLRAKLQCEEGQAFVELLETVAYVIAGDEDLDPESFARIFVSKGVLTKLFALVSGRSSSKTTEALMDFLLKLTFNRKNISLTEKDLEFVANHFRQHMNESEHITLDAFRKMMTSKDPFFAERVFHLFDKDGSGVISLSEFMETIQQYCSQSIDDKARFIFQIYDIDGNGLIRAGELKSVLRACMEENGMRFSEDDLDDLTMALYEDANPQGSDGIYFEQLKAQLQKHNGLLENMSINIERWLLPAHLQRSSSSKSERFSMSYLKNNAVFISFLVVYFAVNIAVAINRAMQFLEFNLGDRVISGDYLYMLARGSGNALHFNCMFILVLMLRRSITFLRSKGFAKFLPLDEHVYLHKLCGTVILVLVLFHTAMHVSHFKFVVADNWEINNETYSTAEWLFTTKPGVFGIIPGTANLTGWTMLCIVLIISLCSLPFVRKGGYFEVFYWTHMLYVPFWILLIIHEEHFWLYIIGPGTVFAIELIIRFIQRRAGKGKTFISSAALLPSQVTHLVIKRPKDFDFQPGDYVFVNIPAIASFEWHPFTISSAPEDTDFISLHIRGVGGWTNKLYEYFEKKNAQLPRVTVVNQLDYSPKFNSMGSKNLLLPAEATKPKLFKHLSCPENETSRTNKDTVKRVQTMRRNYSHRRNQPVIVNLLVPSEESLIDGKRLPLTPRASYAPETVKQTKNVGGRFRPLQNQDGLSTASSTDNVATPVEIIIDGPYGAPSNHIFQAEHAVLIAAGIGVTPFASILQSIMHRYWNSRQNCPNCQHSWNEQIPESIKHLKKVDFFWINREQRSFEWLVDLLTQLEIEQAENSGVMERFLDMHMYITSGLQRTDVKAVGLQLALDLLYNKEHRDLITGLKTRTKTGRPNWVKVFQQLQDQHKGKITVFYCGPPQLGSHLSKKCAEFGFHYKMEIF